jgi:predicted amidophosphoribosyltransferase
MEWTDFVPHDADDYEETPCWRCGYDTNGSDVCPQCEDEYDRSRPCPLCDMVGDHATDCETRA